MPEASNSEFTVTPFREAVTGKWHCEIIITETGRTWFYSKTKATPEAAIESAHAEIAEHIRRRQAR